MGGFLNKWTLPCMQTEGTGNADIAQAQNGAVLNSQEGPFVLKRWLQQVKIGGRATAL